MKTECWVRKLAMEEHPEGGYFRQTYKLDRQFNLPGYDGQRNAGTVIYYLLKAASSPRFTG